MASGAAKAIYGATLGTGAAIDIRTVGFRPRHVEVTNIDSGDEVKWLEGMGDAKGLKRLAAGTAVALSADGITPLSDGFRLGADSDLNVAGETVHWVATE